jgi:hypothetical protein
MPLFKILLPLLVVGTANLVEAQTALRLGGTAGGRGGDEETGLFAVFLGLEQGPWTVTIRAPEIMSVRVGEDTVVAGGTADRYYWDYFDNGQRRCRDRTNGQFVSDYRCSSGSNSGIRGIYEETVGAGLEGAYAFRNLWRVGAGLSWNDKLVPYGILGITSVGTTHRFFANLLIGSERASGFDLGYSYRLRLGI